jgi:alpha-tubulin suppressor-like RCC1 family protein
MKWMISHMLIFNNTGILWDTAYLKDFILAVMQSSFNGTMSVSSVSSFSMDGKRERSSGLEGLSTPKNATLRFEKKEKRYQQGSNLVQLFEKDSSTLNKRELNGAVYSWGQNNEGQVGTPISNVEEADLAGQKKMKIFHPKLLNSLKDTIIVQVSCGHTHSMAITITRRALAWGSNKSSQLGLGENAPTYVYIPTVIPELYDISQISCGSEHTVALTTYNDLYSWGEGEGGLLGHGELKTEKSPRIIESMKKMDINSVVCGGLHTMVLTRQGHVYSWGKLVSL